MVSYDIRNALRKTKTKFILGAGGVGTVAALALGGGTGHAAVGGPVCNVPADYSTIQAAVNDTNCATVKVSAGTYNENVDVTRSVTIKGAKAGQDVDHRTAGNSHESTVTGVTDIPVFNIEAANVTVDGFSITNPNHWSGVNIKQAGNNAKITNNFIYGLGNASYSTNNPTGVNLDNGPDGVRISNNKITDLQSGTKSAQGILDGDSTATNPALDTRIVNNEISNISTQKGAYGVQVNSGAGSGVGYSTVKVLSNHISNLSGGWVHAIGLEGRTPNAVVRNNVISGLNSTNADKVGVWFEDNIFFFTADVNRNNLNVGSNAYGIAVHPSLVAAYPSLNVNGTCNYWGASDGPGAVASGSGSMVGPGVDYTPWLKHSNLKSDCSGGQSHGHNHDGDNDDFNRFFED